MAHNQNSSFLNHFGSAFCDGAVSNNQILSLHSNFNQNYENGSGLISTELALSYPTANSSIGFQRQNGHNFQNSHLDVTGFGQPMFCHSITEVTQTLISSSRLQFANFIDGGFHMQHQPALPPNYIIRFSEFVRNTQLLSSTSTMDRLLSQGNSTPYHRRSNFGNPRFHALNQANCPSTENKSFPSIHDHNQNNSIIKETPTTIDLAKNIDHGIVIGVASNPTPNNTDCASQVQSKNLSLARNLSPSLNPSFDLQDIKSPRNSYMGEPSRKPISISEASNNQRTSQTNNNDSNEDVEYDGITHSLRTKKYGSYICPKCKGDFPSSQLFASHVKAHYRMSESPAERRKRLLAKIRKKNKFRLVHSKDGLTVVPVNNR